MDNAKKYLAGHLPRLEDFIMNRRQFLNRAGMGFGALSLAALGIVLRGSGFAFRKASISLPTRRGAAPIRARGTGLAWPTSTGPTAP
jgi:hypothetical protein